MQKYAVNRQQKWSVCLWRAIGLFTLFVIIATLAAEASSNTTLKFETAKKSTPTTTKLYGEVDMLNSACEKAGLHLSSKTLPADIRSIDRNSLGDLANLQNSDRILSANINDNILTLTIERNGRCYAATICTGPPSSLELDKGTAVAHFSQPKLKKGFALTAARAQNSKQYASITDVLKDHDLVLIVDSSGSMNFALNYTTAESRWFWCCSQASQLAQAAAQVASSMTLVFFNNTYDVLKNVSPQAIPSFFAQFEPGGGTRLSPPLKDQLDSYFRTRSKPLIIVVLTDGVSNDMPAVSLVIKEASWQVHYVGEVSITFLLVGDAQDKDNLLKKLGELPGGSVQNGGMVDVIQFEILNKEGIRQALFEELKALRLATDISKPSHAIQHSIGTAANKSLKR